MTNTESQRKWLKQKFPLVITDEKREKIRILRNDETGTPLAAKRGYQQRRNRKTGQREAQNKSELNCGTVATLVEPENFVFNLVRD